MSEGDLKRDKLSWIDGDMPFSETFGDHFYARDDGRAEVGHVFLGGNGLPDRWENCERFTIAETGFGTGLNFLETWRQWIAQRNADQRLHFVSFEAFPMDAKAVDKAISRWPEMDDLKERFLKQWQMLASDNSSFELDNQTRLSLVIGDALGVVSGWHDKADAWFLDGFAPSRNPDMWSAELMQAIFDKTVPGGTFASYTAAGWVRRNLQSAGFDVEKRRGYGGKRDMITGRKPSI